MASTPTVDITPPIPSSPVDHDSNCCQRRSRSRFRNFFTRRRPSLSPDVTSNTACHNDDKEASISARGSDSSPQQYLCVGTKPTLSSRTYSDTSVPQTSFFSPDGQHSSLDTLRVMNQANTRSFMHVYSKACLRSTAYTTLRGFSATASNGFLSQSGGQPAATAPSRGRGGSSHGRAVMTDDREPSITGGSSLVRKLFVLGDGASILQYDVTGPPDRLPERVFQLTSNSLVSPGEICSEKGPALEITTNIDAIEQARPRTNRSTWTRSSSRKLSAKQPTDTLLMILDNVDLMSIWITSIRNEVEVLRGSIPRPFSAWSTTEKQLPAVRSASTERFSLRQSFLHISRSSSNLRHDLSEAKCTKDQTRLPIPPPPPYQRTDTSRSSAASSTGTASSLDRLRESDANSMTTGATNSLDGSVVLDSPVKETFANLASPLPTLDSRTNASTEVVSQKSTSTTQPTLQERRNLIISQLRLMSNANPSPLVQNAMTTSGEDREDLASRSSADDIVDTTSEAKSSRPVSILSPLPSPTDIRKPFKSLRTHSTDCIGMQDQQTVVRPASSYEGHRSRYSTDAAAKSMYSLFPKKRVESIKSEPLVVPETNNIPGLSQNHATDHLILPPTPTVAITPAVTLSSTKALSKKPTPLKLLAPIEIEQAQRSPAVTDDMLASNFGIQGSKASPSPISPSNINVPTFDDLKFDFSFLQHDFSNGTRRRSNSPPPSTGPGGLRRLKSTPSLRVSRAPSAPVGPPPTGPLPAVPPEDPLQSNSSSPIVTVLREQRISSRSTSSSSSSITKQKSPRQSLADVTKYARSSSLPQPKLPFESSSPLTPVGMPSVISPPSCANQAHDRQRSTNKSINSTKNHKRAKSSGKYSLSMTMKALPTPPIFCDKPSSYYC